MSTEDQALFGNIIGSALMPIDASYSPLFISGENINFTPKWSLDFRLNPTPRVIFKGEEPTFEEIAKALTFTTLPIYMVDVLLVIIKNEIARNKS